MKTIAIDPGREKCGLVMADDGMVVDRVVVPTPSLAKTLREWGRRHQVARVVLGDRTGHEGIRQLLGVELPGVPVVLVREADTSLMARSRYFTDHPPRGWRRLLPLSMQVPPEPYDDYAAEIMLERFLKGA